MSMLLALLLHATPAAVARLPFEAGSHASTPSLAVDPARGLVLTWQERAGPQASLHYALLDPDGKELRRGRVARGSDWFVNWADFPSLAVLDNGDWVSHWLQKSAADTYAYDVRVLRSRDGGGHWSAALTPHTDGTRSEHGFVSLLALTGGRVQLAWLDGRHAGAGHDEAHEGPMSLRAAVLDRRDRVRAGRELDPRTCSCCQTDAARIGERTLLVYRDRSEAEVRDIALVASDPQGHWSAPETVHADAWTIAACPVNGPAIAANGEQVLIAWPTLAQPPLAVRYRLRAADGGYGRLHTLEHADATQGRVDVAPAADGGFAVSWIGSGSAGSALRLAYVGADGEPLEGREIAPVDAGRNVGNPRLAWYAGAHWLVWTESAGAGRTRIALVRVMPP